MKINETIVKDFDKFIDYLTAHEIKLTPSNKFLPKKALHEMNQEMNLKEKDVKPTSDQLSYPLLHLFHNLALSGRLFKVRKYLEPTNRIELYRELNETEKYFFLLETMWVDADWEKIKGYRSGIDSVLCMHQILDYLFKEFKGKPLKIEDIDIRFKLMLLGHIPKYFSFFGLWDMEVRATAKVLTDIESIKLTPLGSKILEILNEKLHIFLWNIPFRRKYGEWKVIPGSPPPKDSPLNRYIDEKFYRYKPDNFISAFSEIFRELKKGLPREEKFVDGIYVFKVSLSKNIWRKMELSAENTLHDFHNIIQDVFNLDKDHLYSFFLDGKAWSSERISSPFEDMYPNADEVKIGELGLDVGQEILYIYDYDDEWRLRIKLEDIRE